MGFGCFFFVSVESKNIFVREIFFFLCGTQKIFQDSTFRFHFPLFLSHQKKNQKTKTPMLRSPVPRPSCSRGTSTASSAPVSSVASLASGHSGLGSPHLDQLYHDVRKAIEQGETAQFTNKLREALPAASHARKFGRPSSDVRLTLLTVVEQFVIPDLLSRLDGNVRNLNGGGVKIQVGENDSQTSGTSVCMIELGVDDGDDNDFLFFV